GRVGENREGLQASIDSDGRGSTRTLALHLDESRGAEVEADDPASAALVSDRCEQDGCTPLSQHSSKLPGALAEGNRAQLREAYGARLATGADLDRSASGTQLVAKTECLPGMRSLLELRKTNRSVHWRLRVVPQRASQIDSGLLEHLLGDLFAPGEADSPIRTDSSGRTALPAIEGVDQVESRPRDASRGIHLSRLESLIDELKS